MNLPGIIVIEAFGYRAANFLSVLSSRRTLIWAEVSKGERDSFKLG